MDSTRQGPIGPRAGSPRGRRAVVVGCLWALPFLLVLANAAAWITNSADLPFWDDWRALMQRRAGSFDPGYLFLPENSTLYPVGKALDSLAQQLIGGNAVVYQALTIVMVLGGALVLQALLLRRVVHEGLLAAGLFLVVVLSLDTGSYWGHTSLGYHQAVPVLGLLAVLALVVLDRPSQPRAVVLAVTIAMLSGLIYISGAVAMAAAGGMLLVVAMVTGPALAGLRRRAGAVGGGVLAAGAATLGLQALALALRGGGSTTPLASPLAPDTWRFALGIVADSLLLPFTRPGLSFAAAAGILAVCLGLAIRVLVQLRAGRSRPDHAAAGVVLVVLLAAPLAYTATVAVARSEFLVPSYPPGTDPFAMGAHRFYDWWWTALWPWLAAVIALGVTGRLAPYRRARAWPGRALAAAAILLTVVLWTRGAFDHAAQYAAATAQRVATFACLERALVDDAPDDCGSGDAGWRPGARLDAIVHGATIGASFSHAIRLPASAAERDVGFQLSVAGPSRLAPAGGLAIASASAGVRLAGPAGASVVVTVGDTAWLGDCGVLEARLELRAGAAGFLAATADRHEASRASGRTWVQEPAGDWRWVSIVFLAEHGFRDGIRMTPPAGTMDVREIVLDCRRPRT